MGLKLTAGRRAHPLPACGGQANVSLCGAKIRGAWMFARVGPQEAEFCGPPASAQS